MRKLFSRVMFALGFLLCVQIASGQDTLYVSTSQVVHLRFASELRYVNLGNGVLVAKVVEGNKDFVAVKAREAFGFYTSMSCLENSGRMHSFVVGYKDALDVFDIDTRPCRLSLPASEEDSLSISVVDGRLAGNVADDTLWDGLLPLESIGFMEKELYHIGCKGYDVSVMCDNIIVKDDMLYIVLSLKNGSVISYSLSNPRFAIESRKKTKRGLEYEKAVFSRYSYNLGTTPPSSSSKMVFAFDKVALVKGQVFRIYLYEKDGARNFVLTLGEVDVNRAKML